jgi:hypothetical protein
MKFGSYLFLSSEYQIPKFVLGFGIFFGFGHGLEEFCLNAKYIFY